MENISLPLGIEYLQQHLVSKISLVGCEWGKEQFEV